MKCTKTLVAAACAALFAACPPPMPTPDDGGEPEQVAFNGNTAGGSIPEIPEGSMNPEPLIDAGPIVVDAGCCNTHFRIAEASEPADATGRIVSGLAVISQRPLTRANGEWSAMACFPLEASTAFRYQFTWDAGVEDGGSIDLADGGTVWREIAIIGSSMRASASEPNFTDVNGELWNFYRAVSSCDGLDGSVP